MELSDLVGGVSAGDISHDRALEEVSLITDPDEIMNVCSTLNKVALYAGDTKAALGYNVMMDGAYSLIGTKIEKLSDLATKDPLTEMTNRRGFEDNFNSSYLSEQRTGQASYLFFIDADKFKSINDTFGYKVGDDTLKHIASEIDCNIRGSDLSGRWGGDEFVAYLVNANLPGVIKVGTKINEAISKKILPDGRPCSVSIGIAEVSRSFVNSKEALTSSLGVAEKALKEMKNKFGRGGTTYFTDGQIQKA